MGCPMNIQGLQIALKIIIKVILLLALVWIPEPGWSASMCEGIFVNNEGIERWQRSLNKLDSELNSFWDKGNRAWDSQYKVLRGAAFGIQALGKIYRKFDEERQQSKGHKVDDQIMEIVKTFGDGQTEGPFDLIRRIGKELEDALGAYDMEKELLDVLEAAGASKSEIAMARVRKEDKRKEVATYLEKYWKTGQRRRLIQQMLEQNPWLDSKDDREFYGRRVQKRLEKLQKKFEDGEFPVEDVEGGTHEMRREVRYIAMMMQFADGLFELDRKEILIKQFKPLKDDPVAESQYATLPEVIVSKSIKVPWVVYLAITKYVYELGLAKDSGGFEHQIVSLLLDSGLISDFRLAHLRAYELVERSKNHHDRRETHLEVEREVLETEIFKKLAKFISKQI